MSSKVDILEQMMTRKKDILANLDKMRNEIIIFDEEYDRSNQIPIQAPQIENTQRLEKETLLTDIDTLKIQNQVLMQKLTQFEIMAAENTVLTSQLTGCRSELSQQTLELEECHKRGLDAEATITSLKEELAKTKKLCPITITESVQTRKIDNSDRIAMINQQQSLILEIERIKLEYEKYKDLIASIESVASTGKICLVSSRGLKVTTMLELAQEIKNFK